MEKDNPNLVDETMQRKDATGDLTSPKDSEVVSRGCVLHPFGESGPVLETVVQSTAESTEDEIPAEYLAVGPMDGRYAKTGKKLSPYFSEYALVKNRVKVEVYWLLFQLDHLHTSEILSSFNRDDWNKVMSIYTTFSGKSFMKVKEFEETTNHDVKSVELFVAEKLKELGMDDLVSFVHMGCTSEDITNPSYARMILSALRKVWIPAVKKLMDAIYNLAADNLGIPMLAHTHGQPATPTSVSKELTVYLYRLRKSLENIQSISVRAKFNGATGNYSALSVAFPEVIWQKLSEQFVKDYLQLDFNPVTTQIESHDYICHILDGIRHFNNVLRDLDLDMWLYISKGYFKQTVVKSEVGSSTMPHKVNPIRFENSEANTKMTNAICNMLSDELPRSRMQRDLSDSSLLRNIGLAFAYSLQAIEQTTSGLQKVNVDTETIAADLDNRWEVLAEPIQTMLRKYGIPDAYNQLKEITRGKSISKNDIHKFINSLYVLSDEDKTTLLELTPASYTGYADDIAKSVLYGLVN